MKEKQEVTEELKMQDQMEWVGRMNNIRAYAEEIVVKKRLSMRRVQGGFLAALYHKNNEI